MKTSTKSKKEFDTVLFVRQQRDLISKEIKGLTPEQQIAYFKKRAEALRRKR